MAGRADVGMQVARKAIDHLQRRDPASALALTADGESASVAGDQVRHARIAALCQFDRLDEALALAREGGGADLARVCALVGDVETLVSLTSGSVVDDAPDAGRLAAWCAMRLAIETRDIAGFADAVGRIHEDEFSGSVTPGTEAALAAADDALLTAAVAALAPSGSDAAQMRDLRFMALHSKPAAVLERLAARTLVLAGLVPGYMLSDRLAEDIRPVFIACLVGAGGAVVDGVVAGLAAGRGRSVISLADVPSDRLQEAVADGLTAGPLPPVFTGLTGEAAWSLFDSAWRERGLHLVQVRELRDALAADLPALAGDETVQAFAAREADLRAVRDMVLPGGMPWPQDRAPRLKVLRCEDMVTRFPDWLGRLMAATGLVAGPRTVSDLLAAAAFDPDTDRTGSAASLMPGLHRTRLDADTATALWEQGRETLRVFGYEDLEEGTTPWRPRPAPKPTANGSGGISAADAAAAAAAGFPIDRG